MNKNLLLVDDDKDFSDALASAMVKRKYIVEKVYNYDEAEKIIKNKKFQLATVDLKMPGKSGLNLISLLIKNNPKIKIVVLTGYASITTAVEAIKLGAIHYLAKPVNADDIVLAFQQESGDKQKEILSKSSGINSIEWEKINQVLAETNYNITKTAKILGIHRRTLQRKLQKKHF